MQPSQPPGKLLPGEQPGHRLNKRRKIGIHQDSGESLQWGGVSRRRVMTADPAPLHNTNKKRRVLPPSVSSNLLSGSQLPSVAASLPPMLRLVNAHTDGLTSPLEVACIASQSARSSSSSSMAPATLDASNSALSVRRFTEGMTVPLHRCAHASPSLSSNNGGSYAPMQRVLRQRKLQLQTPHKALSCTALSGWKTMQPMSKSCLIC